MEFEDKNLKSAVKKAAKVLKVPEEKIKYEVISYGSTGIFGLVGAKKAKIRVLSVPKEKEAVKKKPARKAASKKASPKFLNEGKPTVEKTPPPASDREEKAPKKDITEKGTDPVNDDVAIEKGKAVIQKIIDKITEDAQVHMERKEEGVVFSVEGGKSALIIGKRGQTLEAIQYLADRVVNKNSEQHIRLQVDVAGYLENKKSNIEQRALHLAEKVKKTGKPVTVGEMNVYDRKIVHMCLKEETGVRTQSMGSGFYRKLVIFPKKGNRPRTEKNTNR